MTPAAPIPDSVIFEKTATHRMVWVDVARVVACLLIIANHMAFYSAELYRWVWAEFLSGAVRSVLWMGAFSCGNAAGFCCAPT